MLRKAQHSITVTGKPRILALIFPYGQQVIVPIIAVALYYQAVLLENKVTQELCHCLLRLIRQAHFIEQRSDGYFDRCGAMRISDSPRALTLPRAKPGSLFGVGWFYLIRVTAKLARQCYPVFVRRMGSALDLGSCNALALARAVFRDFRARWRKAKHLAANSTGHLYRLPVISGFPALAGSLALARAIFPIGNARADVKGLSTYKAGGRQTGIVVRCFAALTVGVALARTVHGLTRMRLERLAALWAWSCHKFWLTFRLVVAGFRAVDTVSAMALEGLPALWAGKREGHTTLLIRVQPDVMDGARGIRYRVGRAGSYSALALLDYSTIVRLAQ